MFMTRPGIEPWSHVTKAHDLTTNLLGRYMIIAHNRHSVLPDTQSYCIQTNPLSHVQQVCSRRHWKHLGKLRKIPIKVIFETLLLKEKLLVSSSFCFCYNVYKKHPLQWRQTSFSCGIGLRENSVERRPFLYSRWQFIHVQQIVV